MPINRDRLTGTLVLTPITPVHVGSGNVLTSFDYTIRYARYEVADVQQYFRDCRDDIPAAMDAVANGLSLGPNYVRYSLPYYGDRQAEENERPTAGTGPRSYSDTRDDAPFNRPFAALTTAATHPEPARQQTPPTAAPRTQQAPAQPKKTEKNATVGDVREFIKDPFGYAFLPGSSVKGTLRTAFAYALARHIPVKEALEKVLREADEQIRRNRRARRERVDRDFLKPVFGNGPTVDLFKALHVGDSAPLDVNHGFAMCQVFIMNQLRDRFAAKNTPLFVEALMPEAGPVRIPIRIDRFRLKHDTDLGNAAGGEGVKLLGDPDAVKRAIEDYSRGFLEYEVEFYARRAPDTERFIQTLLKDNSVVLPVGFGTGWHAKTIGRMLSDDQIEALRKRFTGADRSGRPAKNMGNPTVTLFPKTRKWAKMGSGKFPMGWCKVQIEWD